MAPIDEICVSAESSAAPVEAAASARSDPTIPLARRALVRNEPIPLVDPVSFVRYLPPEPTRERFTVRAGAAIDPDDPHHGWLVVEAVTPLGKPVFPLNLTVLLDVSDSMESSSLATLSVLQDLAPDGRNHPTDRLTLARAVLSDLVDRLPTRAEWSLVVFDGTRANTMLLQTPASDRESIDRALRRISAEIARAGSRTPLEEAYAVAGASLDGCADTRILLVTDDHARLDPDADVVAEQVTTWAARGVELWTLSLGTSGLPSPKLDALAASGHGMVVYADTRSEAVEPVTAALRATGAAVRDPAIEVAFGPQVESWRRVGGASGTGTDRWTLPQQLESGWRDAALYELVLADGATNLATVRFSARSPAPGEWTVENTVSVVGGPLVDAAPFVRHRVFALAVGNAFAAAGPKWSEIEALGRALVREPGAARELQGWAALMTARSLPSP